jgi:transcriptional regulator with XRE-family HTH domain
MPRPPIRDPKRDPRALLGRALKRLRLAAGFTTQAAFAARLDGHGEDSVQKAETGNQVPTDDLVLRWLNACDASDVDRELIADLVEYAREADPVIPKFAEPWLDVEPQASIIHAWALDVIPGQLQTYDYAYSLFRLHRFDDDKSAAKATARVKRRAILDDPDSTRMTAILYEPLLRRLVGTPEIMVEQLEHLLQTMDRPNVVIQVVREAGYFLGFVGQFQIASGRTIPDTLNMITVEDQTTNTPAVVDRAIALFEDIRGYALSVTESRALILEAIKRWKSEQE